MQQPAQRYTNYTIGSIVTVVVAVGILGWDWGIGTPELFLLFNTNLGKNADIFFAFWTHLGEEIPWIVLFVYFLVFNRKNLPIYFGGLVVSTLIVQTAKRLILANEARPYKAIAEKWLIHTVEGVQVHEYGSFPSGHTSSAFTIFLLLCWVIPGRWILPIGFLYAVLVGYSRVYLAQHFPRDVGAGMLVAAMSVAVAVVIQKCIIKSK